MTMSIAINKKNRTNQKKELSKQVNLPNPDQCYKIQRRKLKSYPKQ